MFRVVDGSISKGRCQRWWTQPDVGCPAVVVEEVGLVVGSTMAVSVTVQPCSTCGPVVDEVCLSWYCLAHHDLTIA